MNLQDYNIAITKAKSRNYNNLVNQGSDNR